ncbi:HupE/UreJ family protein [Tropicimonas sediminicola]|uniref:HupE / UreJ protein n=1 Tax=Tropicimonas sediminicola TaxID=1031541 RepID=A0A239KHV1_9RHOB|nr:HupE/UreJ family protein [Tropicimonas sediminicola]SNT17570.1 HupE / UreJ protein [Tropicimonas sediminicola]
MSILRQICLALALLFASMGSAQAHALEPGFLELRQIAPESFRVFWRKPDVNGAPMAIDAVLPETCTPTRGNDPQFDGAAWVSAWVAECPGGVSGGRLWIEGLESQRTDVLLSLQLLDASGTTHRLTPEATGYDIPEELSTWGVFTSYFQLGFSHILEGLDHLLFVFALLVLIRDPWRLLGAITAFTVAHSITLALASLGFLSVPGPPVEATIALSIVFLAVEILKREQGAERMSERYPWVVSFTFGLLHGLGFAGALNEIGLPEGDIPAALLAFNLGVEAGQVAFVAVILMALMFLRMALPRLREAARAPHSVTTNVMGYAIGCVATIWLAQRVAAF